MGIDLHNLSGEERLLVALCSASAPLSMTGGEPDADIAELIRGVTDWERFVRLANEHGVIALVANNMGVRAQGLKGAGLRAKGSGEEEEYGVRAQGLKGVGAFDGREIPEGVMRVMENGLMQSIVRNAWLTERWKEVNRILSDAGIKHILLKGMALEHTIYGSKGLRQMNDNDILLKREDCMRAWNLLQEHGFTTELIKSPLHKKIMIDIGKHLPTLFKDGYAIEIHHQLFNNQGGEKSPDYFEDAEEILIGETRALILSKQNQRKHLVSHFEKHAAEGNCQLRMYTDIFLLDETTGLVMPEHFIKKPQKKITMKQKRAAYRAILMSVPARSRLRYITGDVFPSVEWMRKRHGCGSLKALIYYPRRIGKLGWLV